MIARLWSLSAPANISDAEAEPLFIITTIGLPLIASPFLAKYLRVSFAFLLLVETISPSSRKKSVIFIACDNSPPGLFQLCRQMDFYFFQIL